MMMRTRHHHQTTVTTAEEIVATNHEQRNILDRELLDAQYGRYQQQQQRSSNLYARAPRESTFSTAPVVRRPVKPLIPSIQALIKCLMMLILSFFIITLATIPVLIYLGIFWKVLISIFIIWFDLKLWKTN